jgi:hypothetical protein
LLSTVASISLWLKFAGACRGGNSANVWACICLGAATVLNPVVPARVRPSSMSRAV